MKKNLLMYAAVVFLSLALHVPAASALSLVVEGQAPERLDVPYVPTPDEIVAVMISMAGITEKDVVYDLGCGDGRIIIAACLRTGARGVGVDIDPDRITESRRNAAQAGVQGKVTFLQQDLFKTDFSEASVLALYLLPELNLKLRPGILNGLKPGSRVVSHNYDMGDWRPDSERNIDMSHSVYLWTVPANVAGTWDFSMKYKKSTKRHVVRLEQNFQAVTGDISVPGGKAALRDVRLHGDDLRFTVEKMDLKGAKGGIPVIFTARARGNMLEGTFASPADPGIKGTWSAAREPSTARPLDAQRGAVDSILKVLK